MRVCQECGQEFDTFQAKANHVRWKHKEVKYTEEGLRVLREKAATRANPSLKETRTCNKCGSTFEVVYTPKNRWKGKRFCSRKCANSKFQTAEINEKRRQTMLKTLAASPELSNTYVTNLLKSDHSRSSSKAERALAAALQPHGYQRHFLVRTQDIRFDVDIVSKDQKVWIESDGSWHFKKMHEGHNFETTQLRDRLEEVEALNRGVLLIRVNNEASTIEEQVQFILDQVESWDKTSGKVVKFRYPNIV